MGDLIIKLTTNGTAATAQGEIIQTTVLSKEEMALMVTGIEESGEWGRMLYGEIDWSDTRKETGM